MPRRPTRDERQSRWLPTKDYVRQRTYEDIEAELKQEREAPERVPLERSPGNGPYRGPAKVTVLPAGVGYRRDSPGRLGVAPRAFVRKTSGK